MSQVFWIPSSFLLPATLRPWNKNKMKIVALRPKFEMIFLEVFFFLKKATCVKINLYEAFQREKISKTTLKVNYFWYTNNPNHLDILKC